MQKGFTMIELIFVIVIIGILASVAIPKLAATRDDAKQSTLMANARICINDLVAGYKGRGSTIDISSSPACVEVNKLSTHVVYTSDAVNVTGVDSSLDGDHVFKGTNVTY